MSTTTPDKSVLTRNFNRAAADYDRHAVLQKLVLDRLLETLPVFRIKPERILDAGCGTGRAAGRLQKTYPSARIVQLDIAEAMLGIARKSNRRFFSRRQQVCADAERLPLANACMDLVFSSLMLQWCASFKQAIAESARVIRPEGLLLMATLGPATLHEMRESWQIADDHIHVHPFPDIQRLGDEIVRSGFSQPVLESERIVLNYSDLHAIMHDLRHIGAVNSNTGRRRSLTGKKRYLRFVDAYEHYRCENMLPATYEIIYAHAWRAPPAPGGDSRQLNFVPYGEVGGKHHE